MMHDTLTDWMDFGICCCLLRVADFWLLIACYLTSEALSASYSKIYICVGIPTHDLLESCFSMVQTIIHGRNQPSFWPVHLL
jgi:hypothetical protein